MLLSAAKVNRNNYFFGADIDSRCVRMTAINLCLNGLRGEVAHMNSLSMEHWGGYSIDYIGSFTRIPIITKLPANEGIIINNAPFNKADNEKQEQPTVQQGNIITITQTKLEL